MWRVCCYSQPVYLHVCECSIWVCTPGLGTMNKKTPGEAVVRTSSLGGVPGTSWSHAHRHHPEQLSSAPLALWTWPLLTKTEWREMAPCQCLGHIWTNEEQRRASEQRREVLVWSRVSSLGQSHQGWLAACLSLQTSPFEGKSFPTRDHYLVAEMAPWWSRIVECRTSEHAAQAPGGDVPTMGTQHPWDLHVGMMSTVISEFWIFCQGRVCS